MFDKYTAVVSIERLFVILFIDHPDASNFVSILLVLLILFLLELSVIAKSYQMPFT